MVWQVSDTMTTGLPLKIRLSFALTPVPATDVHSKVKILFLLSILFVDTLGGIGGGGGRCVCPFLFCNHLMNREQAPRL